MYVNIPVPIRPLRVSFIRLFRTLSSRPKHPSGSGPGILRQDHITALWHHLGATLQWWLYTMELGSWAPHKE